ncbi:hypothetical protein MTR_5g006810 [Medicago truncatula]|uniref:Uncharacterized protein n=1 Tax=Medicago truncatula TaxID=3880 RepID=G7K3S5_MEDTR|nr:hypothetical protein MTR_5g006810 [Medicago truncatula]
MPLNISVQLRFGDAYRHFNVSVDDNNRIHLDMAHLRAKISYVDEDAEMVNLVDDNEFMCVGMESCHWNSL